MLSFLHQYNLYIILAVATAVSFIWLNLFQKDLRIKWYGALILAVLHTVIGVLCVKLFARFEGWIGPGEAGNLSLYGGVFLMPLFYALGALIFRRKLGMVFDIFTFPLIFTLFCSRFNCLVNGCCLGLPIGSSDYRWPTRGAEMLFYVILLIILDRRIVKRRFDGTAYPIYMLSYGVFRFIIEWFRESEHIFGVVHISHIWSLLSAVVGLIFLILLTRSKAKHSKSKTKIRQ